MITSDQVTQLKELLTPARSILVLLGPNPSFDHLASASTLVLALQAQGKEVILAAPDKPSASAQDLVGLEQLKTELGHQNLHVTFDYTPTSVDKVSYHIDEDKQKFYLVIKPQKGAQPLSSSSVEFAYAGADADLVFLIGVHQLESLDQLYAGYEDLYQNTTLVTLHTFEPEIGHIKLNSSGFSSMSEATGTLLLHLAIELNPDMATNILAGIEDSTDSFRSLSTTADTFELVARLIRVGARRLKRKTSAGTANPLAAALGNKPGKTLVSGTASKNTTSTPKAESKATKDKTKQPSKSQDGPRTFYP